MGRVLVLVIVMLAGSLAAGCSHDEPAPTGPAAVYTGTLPGTDAVFALSWSGNDVVSYVCGGDETYATMSRWFCGEPGTGSGGPYFYRQFDGWVLDVSIGDATLEGTLQAPSGEVYPVSARAAPEGTIAGLYAPSEVGGCETGVVVRQRTADDTPVVQGTSCEHDRFEQVTPVLPVALTDGQLQVVVRRAAGEETLWVRPVQPILAPDE